MDKYNQNGYINIIELMFQFISFLISFCIVTFQLCVYVCRCELLKNDFQWRRQNRERIKKKTHDKKNGIKTMKQHNLKDQKGSNVNL